MGTEQTPGKPTTRRYSDEDYLDAEVHGYGIGIDRDHSRYFRVLKIRVVCPCRIDCGFVWVSKGRPCAIGLQDRRRDVRLTRTGARTRYKRHRYPRKDRSPSHALSMTDGQHRAPEHAI